MCGAVLICAPKGRHGFPKRADDAREVAAAMRMGVRFFHLVAPNILCLRAPFRPRVRRVMLHTPRHSSEAHHRVYLQLQSDLPSSAQFGLTMLVMPCLTPTSSALASHDAIVSNRPHCYPLAVPAAVQHDFTSVLPFPGAAFLGNTLVDAMRTRLSNVTGTGSWRRVYPRLYCTPLGPDRLKIS